MTTEANPVSSKLSQDWTWVTHHLAALVITGALVIGSVYGVESLIAKHDAGEATKYTALLNTQAEQIKTVQSQLAANEAAEEARDAAYQKTIAQLAQSIATRNTQVQQQVKNDATLSTQEAAVRLATQTGAKAGEVTATATGVDIDLPVTRGIVTSLDLLPVAQADLADTQKQLVAQKALTVDAQNDATGQKNLANMYQGQLTIQTEACNATIKSLKAKRRKSILKAFGIGFVSGYIAGKIL